MSQSSLGIAEQIEQWQGAMTVEDLALILKCSKKTLYKRIKKGKLPTIKIGSLIRLCPHTVAAWLREQSLSDQSSAANCQLSL